MAQNSLIYDVRYTIVRADNIQNAYVSLDEHCNAVTVKNIDGTNTVTATVNDNVVLQPGDSANKIPGESFSIPGNYGELYKGRLQIKFSGAAGQCLVIEKYYLNYDKICNTEK